MVSVLANPPSAPTVPRSESTSAAATGCGYTARHQRSRSLTTPIGSCRRSRGTPGEPAPSGSNSLALETICATVRAEEAGNTRSRLGEGRGVKLDLGAELEAFR